MAKTQRTRVLGSGFSVMEFQSQPIGFCQRVTIVSPQPVAPPQVIQPLNANRPIEIVTAGAHTNGTLTLTLTELYNEAIWQRLSAFADSSDIVDIMRTVAANNDDGGIKINKVIRPPIPGRPSYSETFYNCVINTVADGETIDVTTMQVDKDVEVWYTHSQKSWVASKF